MAERIDAAQGAKKQLTIPDVQLPPTDAAYLAGLIDGEGYWGMIRRLSKNKKGTMTHPILSDIAWSIGIGDVCQRKPSKPQYKSRPAVKRFLELKQLNRRGPDRGVPKVMAEMMEYENAGTD